MQVLPPVSTPTGWPPFELDPPLRPTNRSSLGPEPSTQTSVPPLVPPLRIGSSVGPKQSEASMSTAVVPAAVAAVLAAMALAGAVLLWRRRRTGGQRKWMPKDAPNHDTRGSAEGISEVVNSWRAGCAEFSSTKVCPQAAGDESTSVGALCSERVGSSAGSLWV